METIAFPKSLLAAASEEEILPKGNGIVVKSDYDVAYAERAHFPAENPRRPRAKRQVQALTRGECSR